MLNNQIKIVTLNNQFGLKTVFYKEDSYILGYSKNDTIYINENAPDIELVNKHEFLHFFENAEKFNQVKHELLANLTFEERKELKARYELKYYGMYEEDKLNNLIETEIAIDIMCGNGNFRKELSVIAKESVNKIVLQPIQFMNEKRFLNIGLSKQLNQQFNQLTQWEKLFVLNYYNAQKPFPKNKETKYTQVRQDINTALEDLYNFIENTNNFEIDYLNNPYLEREFNGEINALIARGQNGEADYALKNKNASLKEMALKIQENLYAEIKHAKDFIASTNYEPAFKFLMLNETLTKVYRKEKQINDEKTIVEKRELNKSIAGYMTLDQTVLDTIYSNLDKQSNFANLYFAGLAVLSKSISQTSSVNVDNVNTYGKGQWIKFEGKTTDQSKYIENSKKLASLVQNTPWCTKQLASSQLEQGDFYVFVDNKNNPHIAVKLTGNEIDEVRGIQNGNAQEIEDDYRDVVLSFLKNNKEIKYGKEWLDSEEWNKRLVQHAQLLKNGNPTKEEVKLMFKDYFENKQYKKHAGENSNRQALLNEFKLNKKYVCDILGYKEEEIHFGDYTPSDEKTCPYTCIFGNANFENSKVKSLGNLTTIGGDAWFKDSQVKDLGNLTTIGGNADFRYSQITSLGNLKTIGENADFRDSQVKNLGNLTTIGGDADFINSKVANLGNLTTINGNVFFHGSQIKGLGNLKTIDGYAHFKNSKITDLGNLTTIGRDAYFSDSQITSLGNLTTIGGDAYFSDSQVSLGNLTTIKGNAYFSDSQVTSLGNLTTIGGDADFKNSKVTDLGNLTTIGGDAWFKDSQVKDIGNLTTIKRHAYFYDSQITSLGNLKTIDGYADFRDSQITSLGNLTLISGDADFSNSKITDLGNLTTIGGDADFKNSKITDLGNLKQINGEIYNLSENLMKQFVKKGNVYERLPEFLNKQEKEQEM